MERKARFFREGQVESNAKLKILSLFQGNQEKLIQFHLIKRRFTSILLRLFSTSGG